MALSVSVVQPAVPVLVRVEVNQKVDVAVMVIATVITNRKNRLLHLSYYVKINRKG